MNNLDLYPLKLQPALHVKVWGGDRLGSMLNKRLPSAEPYGESWELHDSAIVADGPLAGQSLGRLAREYGGALIGAGNDPDEGVPLLAKFIDAGRWLSIQVHPDDEQARRLEGEARGKTEAWLVIHAEENARLVTGFSPGVTRASIAAAIAANQLEAHLQFQPVVSGDALYIPANTVHALGPGLLIYEIQQSSDTTYRLYDWGRLGLNGQPRELHINKSLDVANFAAAPRVTHPRGDKIVDGDYFTTWRHQLRQSSMRIESAARFQALTCLEGEIRVESERGTLTLAMGETALMPACLPAFALSGTGALLRSHDKVPRSAT